MAQFNDLKIPQLKKELDQRGLATNGLKTELQSRLPEAIEAENINVEEYVFHMELEKETTKIEEKEEAQCSSKIVDINMIFAAMSQMSTQISTEVLTQISTQISQLESRLSTQLEEQFGTQDARISAQEASQLEEQFAAQDARISAQVSSQLKEQDTRISQVTSQVAEVSSQIKIEVDELKDRLRELQLNRPIMPLASAKVKPPSFDGTVPFDVF